MTRRSVLKNSLLALYRDSEEITESLKLIDYSALDRDFYSTLFTHISEEDFYEVDNFLNSDKVMMYYNAVDKAALAMTNDLAKLIELALLDKGVTKQ